MISHDERRIWREFYGTAFMAVVSTALIAYEWNYARRRVAGEAVVEGASYAGGRSGLMINHVVHQVGKSSVKATLPSFYSRLVSGQKIPVLYLPEEPGAVVLDLSWERHHRSLIALSVLMILVTREAHMALAERRRRTSLLLGDHPPVDLDATEYLHSLEGEGRPRAPHDRFA